jgi:hypothetical protein
MADLTSIFGAAFDATKVEPATGFDPIPRGRYLSCIEKSEMKTTRDGYGQYLELAFKVLDGEYSGRVVFARLNLVNQNPKATEIAYREFSALCRACGVLQVQDSAELHSRPLIIQVELENGQDKNGNPRQNNVIKAYYSTGTAAPAPVRAAAAPAATTPPARVITPPPAAAAPRAPWKARTPTAAA